MDERLSPVHPGEVLREEFMIPLDITAYRLAKTTGLTENQIGDIMRGERSITAATALRLEAYFGVEAVFWLNLQNHYDLEAAHEKLTDALRDIPLHPRAEMLKQETLIEDAKGILVLA